MKEPIIMAIETSCDETAIAIFKDRDTIIANIVNSYADQFYEIGGVVPELVSRMHVDNIFYVYQKALDDANLTINDIDYIAVTYGPGLIGSLLVGVNFANALSYLHNIPIIPVNHMQGHIYSVFLENKIEFPHMSLIISGGHSEFVLLEENMNFKLVGETLDDAVGECYDKVAKMLGLGYPGGPLIEKLALDGVASYKMPFPVNDNSLDMSFSGLKSACFNLVNSDNMKGIDTNINDFSKSFQDKVIEILSKKLLNATKLYDFNSVSVVGGVCANKAIIEGLKNVNCDLIVPSFMYATDNAAMIGRVAYELYDNKSYTSDPINANPNITVEDMWIS